MVNTQQVREAWVKVRAEWAYFAVVLLLLICIGYLAVKLNQSRENERELSRMLYKATKQGQPPVNLQTQ